MKRLDIEDAVEVSLEKYHENVEGPRNWLERNIGQEYYYWYSNHMYYYHFKYEGDSIKFEKMMNYIFWLYRMDLFESYNIVLGSPYIKSLFVYEDSTSLPNKDIKWLTMNTPKPFVNKT